MDISILNEYRKLKIEAEQIGDNITELKEKLYALPALSYEPNMGGGGIPRSRHEQLAVEYIEMVDKYNEKQEEINRLLKEIEAMMNQLPTIERVLLREHYINGKTWEEVAERLGYSERWIYKIRKKAIKDINTLQKSSW